MKRRPLLVNQDRVTASLSQSEETTVKHWLVRSTFAPFFSPYFIFLPRTFLHHIRCKRETIIANQWWYNLEQKRKNSYRHGVEEQAHKSHQESNDQELDQAHFVVIPQKILQGLERVHEPRERWIRSAARTGQFESKKQNGQVLLPC